MLKTVLSAAIVTTALAAGTTGALAGHLQQEVKGVQLAATTASETAIGGRVPVMEAAELIDRTVYDENVQAVGVAKFLLIDAQTGKVNFLLFASGNPQEVVPEPGPLTAIPWANVDITLFADNAIFLDVSKSNLDKAPQFTIAELGTITKPSVFATITEYFADPASGASRRDDTSRDRISAPQLLLAREFVATISGPDFRVENQITGSTVHSSQGTAVGDIERLVVDVAEGQVAFALIDRGAFLGMGGTWFAIPVPALNWVPANSTYSVPLNDAELAKVPALPREQRLPTYVRKDDIAQLHEAFGVPMY